MVEFTKDIATLTDGGGGSPTLRTNTGSLATDTIAAVGFGLDLFRKNRADKALAATNKAQQERASVVSEGMLEYRNTLSSLSDQGLSKRVIAQKSQAVLDRYKGYELEIIGGLKKVEGRTLETTQDEAAGIIKEENQRKEDRQTLELEATTAAVQAGIALADPSKVTPEELHRIKVAGARQTAINTATLAQLSAERDALSDKTAKQNMQSRMFSTYATTTLGPAFTSTLGSFIQASGGLSPENVPAVIDQALAYKATITSQVYDLRNKAAALGEYIAPDAVKQTIQDMESGVDNVIDLLRRDDSLKALQNNIAGVFEVGIAKMMSSSNPDEKFAANVLLTSRMVGIPPELGNFNSATAFIVNASKGFVDTGKTDFAQTLKTLPNIVGSTGPITPDHQETNVQVFDAMLNNSPAKVKEIVKQGGLDAITKSTVQQGSDVVPEQSRAEVADLIYRAGAPAISANIARIMSTQTRESVTPSLTVASRDFRQNYSFDVSTLQFKKTNSIAPRNTEIEQLNTLIRNQQESFRLLGQPDLVARFNEDVAMAIGLAPTNKD